MDGGDEAKTEMGVGISRCCCPTTSQVCEDPAEVFDKENANNITQHMDISFADPQRNKEHASAALSLVTSNQGPPGNPSNYLHADITSCMVEASKMVCSAAV